MFFVTLFGITATLVSIMVVNVSGNCSACSHNCDCYALVLNATVGNQTLAEIMEQARELKITSDDIAGWQPEAGCENGVAKTVRKADVPFVQFGKHVWTLMHQSVWFEIQCPDNTWQNYNVDFSKDKLVEQRWGKYQNYHRIVDGPVKIELPMVKVVDMAKTDKGYEIGNFNCYHYASELYEKVTKAI